ncbi:hypothetical protein QIH01_05645 [Brevibacillus brevis]|uniref:hypothetical protein n=1 Tax=Brevibacillus brevis TaxID=1393 RepID=UPI0007D8A93F|nr:hypothetical protein [Brevibacillus brevis]WGV60615.1 hypothetical protein QIH01_05645 [Brevibacillus brevis]
MHYLLIPLFGVPVLVGVLTAIFQKPPFWKKWGLTIASALLIYGGCFAANVYWQVKYGIPVLPTESDLEVFFYFCILLVFVCILLYIGFLITMRKQFWKMNLVFLCTAFGLFSFFAAAFLGMGPFLKKAEYVIVVQKAKDQWKEAKMDNEKPIDLALVYSRQECTKNCVGYPYSSLILVRNQSDQPVEIDLKLRLKNKSGNVLKEVEAIPLKLASGEITEVWTDDSYAKHDFWARASAVTDERVADLEYQYSIIDRR